MVADMRHLSMTLLAATLLFAAAPASAQSGGSTPPDQPNPSGTTRDAPGSMEKPPTHGGGAGAMRRRRPTDRRGGGQEGETADAESWSATVRVRNAVTGEPVGSTGVILRAAPPTGPFQQREPEPTNEWEGRTDEKGVATFSELPGKVAAERREVYAAATHAGIEFTSARRDVSDGVELTVEVYPRAQNADDVVVERLRTVFQPWEDYLVVTQNWTLKVTGKFAVDTTTLPGDRFDNGLPLELPVDAEGIHLFGPGESKIVESTANWKGVLRPGETVQLRLRFSMSASAPSFVYRQTVDYPIEETELVLPLQTERPKVGRLADATLAAKGFESVEATRRVPGFRSDNEYLYASGKSLEPGESFEARLTGLPFEQPLAPWVALALGLVGFGVIVGLSRWEVARLERDENVENAAEALEKQRDALLDELAELERAYEDGDVSEVTYETESLRLRERLTLIMDKLDELDASD